MVDDDAQIAWTAMRYRCRVVAADGTDIGTAESLLGDEEEDIFHGIAVKTHSGRLVEIPAAHVGKITGHRVVTDLDEGGIAALENYREEKWFRIGWGGLFRKHPEWQSRSGS